MTFELHFYQQILSSITSQTPFQLDGENLNCDIAAEADRIKQRIDGYEPTEIHTQQTNVQYHLGCLSRFSLKLESAKASTSDITKCAILDLLLKNTDEIIDHLLEHFPNELNTDIRISEKRTEDYLKINEARIIHLLESLETLKIDPPLQSIVKEVITPDNNNNNKNNTILYQLLFAQDIMSEIEQLKESRPSSWQIAEILIAHQYNHPQFYKYVVSHLKTKQRETAGLAEQYMVLNQLNKDVSQIVTFKKPSYYNHLPDIQETITTAIRSELNFMKEMDFLNSELINSGLLESTYKIGISVKQLAFLIFLCMDCGIIIEKKAKSVHQFIISHVTTKEKEQISEKSFSNGYYVHLPEDIRKVSEFLAKMLALSQRLY